MSRRTAPVVSLTTARTGLSEDVSGRTRRYLVLMGIRTLCFALALPTDGWVRWLFVAGAVFLPYVGVVVANGGREPSRSADLPAALPMPPAIGTRVSTPIEPDEVTDVQ